MLKVKNISKTFEAGTANEKNVLRDLSFEMQAGDFVTVIGGNGAGKSTLLNAVAGMFPVESGSIEIDGVDVTKMPEYTRAEFIGRVFQDPRMGTASNMTIEENLAMALRRGKKRGLGRGLTMSEKNEFCEHLKILDLGLEDRLSTKTGFLSGGQRQALTLLMATITRPKLLLLDEHTAALDPKTAAKVIEITERIIREEALTALMVTHNMRDALKLGNRIIMMHEGKIMVDVKGEEKKNLQVSDLLKLFEKAGGDDVVSDRMLLG